MKLFLHFLLTLVWVSLPLVAVQSEPLPSMEQLAKEVGFEQKLSDSIPLDTQFIEESGKLVSLKAIFETAARPIVLVLGYHRCPMLCSAVLSGLVETLNDLQWSAGKEFDLIDISIDPKEQAEKALGQKRVYLKRYRRPTAESGWHFLCANNGSEVDIKRIAHAVGFHYAYDPTTSQYAHPSGIVVLTPKGQISQYLLGASFSAKELHDAIKQASANKVGSPIAQLLLLCFHYNPTQGKYGMYILYAMRIGAILTLTALGGAVVWAIRKGR